jgi:hypothetical protein
VRCTSVFVQLVFTSQWRKDRQIMKLTLDMCKNCKTFIFWFCLYC